MMEPAGFKPFMKHGVELRKTGDEGVGTCVFCGRDNKFSVNGSNTLWKCLVCEEGGNAQTFLAKLWELCTTEEVDYSKLAKERKLKANTLKKWGVTKNILTNEWIVPGFNEKGEVVQLYRWVLINVDGKKKRKLLATPECGHGVFGGGLVTKRKPYLRVTEGPWDAMKLWEELGKYKESNDIYVPADNVKESLRKDTNVIAVPGCSTFKQSWENLFRNKKVQVFFDNDYPRRHPKTKRKIEPASFAAIQSLTGKVGTSTRTMEYLSWDPNGGDHNPKLPKGHDVRDALSNGKTLPDLLRLVLPVQDEWKKNKGDKADRLFPRKCESWQFLRNTWKKGYQWSDGLDTTLAVMLASSISTDAAGEQLWVKVLGPASCGKSTLSEALSVARNYVVPKDTFTGLVSGQGEEGSNSFVLLLKGKTLIINDGDTLLQSPNLGQILAELRTFYGRNIRVQFKNKASADYENINATVIVCGTSSLKKLDTSELGERFLDCVIMEEIDPDMEDAILARVVRREMNNVTAKGKTKRDPMVKAAMEYTGGYVEYLRENADKLLGDIDMGDSAALKISRMAKYVALMRARPSKTQEEQAEREMAGRLASQLTRLGLCLAAVTNRQSVDAYVLRRVLKVALDTARGTTQEIVDALADEGELDSAVLSVIVNRKEADVKALLRFLKAIKVVRYRGKAKTGSRRKPMWGLTTNFQKIMKTVESM